jgi:hypothetical protein
MTPQQEAWARAAMNFWERAALTALPGLLGQQESTIEEVAGMAADCADHLLKEWRDRFCAAEETGEKP